MAGVAYVAFSVPRLVSVEVVELRLPAPWQRSIVAVVRVKAVVDVPVKALAPVEPGSSSKKHPAHKPIGPIVAIGSTVIWLIVEVPIGAHRSHSNFDCNLSSLQGCAAQQGSRQN
jgi:hypothetical protein